MTQSASSRVRYRGQNYEVVRSIRAPYTNAAHLILRSRFEHTATFEVRAVDCKVVSQ